MNDRLSQIIWQQCTLQEESFGYNFNRMTPDERIQYIKDMSFALIKELSEATDEVGWKSWAKSRHINEEKYVGELIDMLHFLINLFLVTGMDPSTIADTIYDKYWVKSEINAQRQRDGYDGVSGKCIHCKRALDDPAVSCWRRGDQAYCNESQLYSGVDINIIQ